MTTASRGLGAVWMPVAVGLLAFLAYATTAARTITWWDGSSYPLAAYTLGIPGAPGSLLLTLLGWPIAHLPIFEPVAFRLNLLAALVSAILAAIVTRLTIDISRLEDRHAGAPEIIAGGIAGLTFAFAVTPWTHATQFTPYGLSALFTGLILLAAFSWWQAAKDREARPQLFLLFLLFGLDVSVHRTNLLLLPAAFLWVALRRPGAWLRPGNAGAAALGLALGLAFHLLLIPIAARDPWYLVENPRDLAGFWDYVSLDIKGGGFLVNLWPRTASLAYQLGDYVAFLRRNLDVLWFLPAVLAIWGGVVMARRNPHLAAGILGFLVMSSLGAVAYFNLPQNYMRSIDRHYLPSLVFAMPLVAVGAAQILRNATLLPRAGRALAWGMGVVLACVPILAWSAHKPACDLSGIRFAETFSRDVLEPLPENAILLTNGDNDTLPLWYLQHVEGVRTDVTVINLPLANSGDFVRQLRQRDPSLAGLLEGETLRGVLHRLESADTTIVTHVERREQLGLPSGWPVPDTVSFHATGELYGQDRVVLDLLRLNRWRRPVHFAATVTRDNVPWLWPYARLAGLTWQIVPTIDPAAWNLDETRRTLFERVRYADVADSTVLMDRDTRMLCRNYLAALFQLAMAQAQRNNPRASLETLQFMNERVPLGRLGFDQDVGASMAAFRASVEAAVAAESR